MRKKQIGTAVTVKALKKLKVKTTKVTLYKDELTPNEPIIGITHPLFEEMLFKRSTLRDLVALLIKEGAL